MHYVAGKSVIYTGSEKAGGYLAIVCLFFIQNQFLERISLGD